MNRENILTLGRYRFPIILATFCRITDNGQGGPGWEFNVCTGPPLKPPKDSTHANDFPNGVRFYAEGDPIPLPYEEDLTGVELTLKEPFDPVSGEVYFTIYTSEHTDVSDLTLRFVERQGSEYRMMLSALAHDIYQKPTKLIIDTWIERLPEKKYGSSA